MRRYLAYGSNLCLAQMARRCPVAVPGEVTRLEGWRFIINGEGCATLLLAPGVLAWGLVWRLTPACEAALDSHEGVETGEYRKVEWQVGGQPALVYLAAAQHPGPPRAGYLERILTAATSLGLPPDYLAELGGWAGVR